MKQQNKNYQEVNEKRLTSKKRARIQDELLTPQQAADFIGKCHQTILNWCKDGSIDYIPYEFNTRMCYKIPFMSALKMKTLIEERRRARIFRNSIKMTELGRGKKKSVCAHSELINAWDRMCEQGLLEGSPPHSENTRKVNYYYLEKFLIEYNEVSLATLKAFLAVTPTENFAKRMKVWSATYCFYRWLVQEDMGYPQELELWHKYKPQRKLPPKQYTLTEPQIYALERACESSFDRLLVTLLAQTGLRSFELCSLKRKDIDLEGKQLRVLGKGGKYRRIGLNKSCLFILNSYLMEHPKEPNESMFINTRGDQLQPGGIQMRLDKLGKKTGIKCPAHSFRRGFVTINADKGRPLHIIQILCGHSSITITRAYCQTTEEEAVKQAQGWDW